VIAIGDIVADKYRIDRAVGNGGMAYVMAATHLTLDKPVAIKVLLPGLCENQEAITRFLREARASVRIQGDHVARVLDVGTLADGAPFMVMELLEGRDLAHELRERKMLPVGEAVDYVLQAGEALAEAHAFGIVHRDLKPANLFLTSSSDGSALIKVLDFGISKALVVEGQSSTVTLTDSHDVLGSPCYMSPEQVRQPKKVDSRSDIWSLGIILHELLGGFPPFVSDTPMGVLAAVVTDDPPSLLMVRDDVPPDLEVVIAKCLEKEASQRYQDVVELATALKSYAPKSGETAVLRIAAVARAAKERALRPSRSPASVLPVVSSLHPPDAATLKSSSNDPVASPPSPPRHDTQAGWDGSPSLPTYKHRWLWAGGSLALATVVFSLGWFLLRPRSSSRSQEAIQTITSQANGPADGPRAAPLPSAPPANAGAPAATSASTDPTRERDATTVSIANASASQVTAPRVPGPLASRSAPAGEKKTPSPKGRDEPTPDKGAPSASPPSPRDPLEGRE
jgi:serine/threonine protein kinase